MRRHRKRWAIGGWLLVGLLLPAVCRADDAQPCQLKRGAALDMTVQRDGRVAVPVGIQNRKFLLTVDTGDVFSILSEGAASALQKDPRVAGVRSAFLGGVTLSRYVVVDDLHIGQLTASEFGFMVAPQRLLGANDGLLGPDIMSRYDVDFDFAHAKLNIISSEHCPGAVVYWTQGAYGVVPMRIDREMHIKIAVTLDGKTLDAMLDTGAYKSTLSAAAAKSLFGIDENSAGVTRREGVHINGGSASTSYHYPFGSLTFTDVSVLHPDIDILQEPEGLSNDAPMLIGINVLRQLHVYIAYKEQTLYVTPAEAQ